MDMKVICKLSHASSVIVFCSVVAEAFVSSLTLVLLVGCLPALISNQFSEQKCGGFVFV